MIEAQGLSRRFGEHMAVQDVSFSVPEGEILGILGPNGAGKTTTIRMITGFLPPTTGQITVDGLDLFQESRRARGRIGYLPENVALYPEMRVHEYLSYRARLQGMGRSEVRGAIGTAVERCLLEEVTGQVIGTLSKGFRQRVGLAATILHQPQVLVLDEPTVGLDPKQIIAIRELIRELGGTRTLLLSTHILPEVEQLCDRVLIIDRGKVVAEGSPKELGEQAEGSSQVKVTLKNCPGDATTILATLPGVRKAQADQAGESITLSCEPGHDLREAVFQTAVSNGWVLLELSEKKASLEDVFVRLTGRGDAAGADSSTLVDSTDSPANGAEAARTETGDAR
jgi:ABC-2 type transport system ATP-binding protein